MSGSANDPREATRFVEQPTEAIRNSLEHWAIHVLAPQGQMPAAHHKALLSELEAISRGQNDRLMILMPPGSAKSTYASILFPAWWFVQHPRSSILAASHTADLAAHFARQVRTLITEHDEQLGYRIVPDNRAAARWQTTGHGEYFAAGIRGPITGRRADLAIIDDPVKSWAMADSPVEREYLWNWYCSDLTTRLKPQARVILIMTRWHEEDVAGRLLACNRDEWRLLSLPAQAEDADPLGRTPGEPLWPEWENADAILRKRTSVGERVWSALFQQSPRPIEGGLFRVDRVQVIEHPPIDSTASTVRAWDLAATIADHGRDPDWTVGLKLCRDVTGRWVVLDVERLRGSPYDVEKAITRVADDDGRLVTIGLPEDPGQAGRMQVSHFAQLLAGYRVRASRETGSKITRAAPIASQVEAGNLLIVRADWNYSFLEELRDFPLGRKDDQVDALSRAFTMLTDSPGPARRLSVPFLSR